MIKKVDRNSSRLKRHRKIRKKINGTSDRPRMCIYKSAKNIYVQIIDDVERKTLISASSLESEIKGKENYTGNKKTAREVGMLAAKKAIDQGISNVVFDRGGYIYHGRIKEVAEGAREAGLNF